MLFARSFTRSTRHFSVLVTTLLLLLTSVASAADYGDWAWLEGNGVGNQPGIYGSRETPSPGIIPDAANTPGARYDSVSRTDPDGNLWLFGGTYPGATDFHNDLWKYDPSINNWAWMKGSNQLTKAGVYGTLGVPDPANTPGARYDSVSWTDPQGNLWLFGGYGYGASATTSGNLSDLWKYDTTSDIWTWMKGPDTINQGGIYGSQGVDGPGYRPGARQRSVSWTDANGKLWLYGGNGNISTGGSPGILCDLWKYDPATNNWAFMRGITSTNQPGIYGGGGVSRPGSRENSVSWTDPDGNLWLYGGAGYGVSGGWGYLSDLWRYEVATNNWYYIKGSDVVNQPAVYGTKGIGNLANRPGARQWSHSWTDTQGRLWLFGGVGYLTSSPGDLNDMWMYNPDTNHWTWVEGSNSFGQPGVYGTQSVAAPANNPGSRFSGVTWVDYYGTLWLFGGFGYAASGISNRLNDLWKYDTTTGNWTWIKGSNATNQAGTYGVQGEPENRPGARHDSVSWTGADGNLWLFGGFGTGLPGSSGQLNDMWKYDTATAKWMWMQGNALVNAYANYGTQGMPNAGNTPGARQRAASMAHPDGTLWLFGGTGLRQTGSQSRLNDLWRYDPPTNKWTWMKGSTEASQPGVYGTQGVPAPENTPGSRHSSEGWADAQGNLWIFGGNMFQDISTGQMNDLWKYDPTTNNWTYMKGSGSKDQVGIYGTRGVPAPANTPGARENSVGWTDASGNLWLFGGYGIGSSAGLGYLNDLWKYDPTTNQWTWISGSNARNQPGNYGTQGVAAPTNRPGGRHLGNGWMDSHGHVYILGGFGFSSSPIGPMNDRWKYEPATDTWTWLRGSSSTGTQGTYITRGAPNPANMPGARDSAVTWITPNHHVWLFGGTLSNPTRRLNDLWKLEPIPNSGINLWGEY